MSKRKKKPGFKLRSIEQLQAELSQITGEQERLEWFEQVVKDFDKADALNELKHRRPDRRHEFNPHWLDQNLDEEISIPPQFKLLNNSDGWLDCIFSQRPEDLHELVEDKEVCEALRGLTGKRREALFYRVVHGYPASEIAALHGVSDRNVRKLYGKAIAEVRKRLDIEPDSN